VLMSNVCPVKYLYIVLLGGIMSREIGEQYLTHLWMVPNIGIEHSDHGLMLL
jgi:hypothetical protein